ncbi:hypothetical protein LTS18_000634, partial [Coniosporium uncinatum]
MEEDISEEYDFTIRACAEKAFLDLAIHYKQITVQPLLAALESITSGQNNDILFKDSVYCALGLAAPILEKNLDIDQLVRYILVKEVGTRETGYNIIRRRVAILLGSWAPMGYPVHTQNVVNKVFKCLLDKGDKLNDTVVRVTAGRQLKNVADAFEFSNVEFHDEAHAILYALMGLITEVDLTETKLALLNTLSVIIERMSELMSPFAKSVFNLLPPIWKQNPQDWVLKQTILGIMTRLVNALKGEHYQYRKMAYYVIDTIVAPGSEERFYLLEDALDLWHSCIINTPTGEQPRELIVVAKHLIPLLELGSDSLWK